MAGFLGRRLRSRATASHSLLHHAHIVDHDSASDDGTRRPFQLQRDERGGWAGTEGLADFLPGIGSQYLLGRDEWLSRVSVTDNR